MSKPKYSLPRLERDYTQWVFGFFLLCFLWEGILVPLAHPYAGSHNKMLVHKVKRLEERFRDVQDTDASVPVGKREEEITGLTQEVFHFTHQIEGRMNDGWRELWTVQNRFACYFVGLFAAFLAVPFVYLFLRTRNILRGPWHRTADNVKTSLVREGWKVEGPADTLPVGEIVTYPVDEENGVLLFAERDSEKIVVLVALPENEKSVAELAKKVGVFATLEILLAQSGTERRLVLAVPTGLRETLLSEESDLTGLRHHVSHSLFYDPRTQTITRWQTASPPAPLSNPSAQTIESENRL